MKRFTFLTALLVSVFALNAGHMTNTRYIPNDEDFVAQGGGYRWRAYDSLLTELANILSAVKNAEALSMNKLGVDTIHSNPIIDSIAGADIIAGNPAMDSVTAAIILGANRSRGTPPLIPSVGQR